MTSAEILVDGGGGSGKLELRPPRSANGINSGAWLNVGIALHSGHVA